MKRVFAIMAAVLLVFVSVKAEFRYGPIIGGGISNLHFKQDLVDIKKVPSFSAGVLSEMMFAGIGFGMDLGLKYEMRGAKMDLGSKPMWADQGYGNERYYMHYLVIPIHLRFKYTRLNGFEDNLAPFVYVGPSIGMLVAHSRMKAMDNAFGELGLDMGIGAEIKRKWQVSFNYNIGLTYATKAKILTDYSAKNRVMDIRVAYLF